MPHRNNICFPKGIGRTACGAKIKWNPYYTSRVDAFNSASPVLSFTHVTCSQCKRTKVYLDFVIEWEFMSQNERNARMAQFTLPKRGGYPENPSRYSHTFEEAIEKHKKGQELLELFKSRAPK